MYDAAAQTYEDEEFVSVKASSDERLFELADIDMCFHTSLLPNARAKVSVEYFYGMRVDMDNLMLTLSFV